MQILLISRDVKLVEVGIDWHEYYDYLGQDARSVGHTMQTLHFYAALIVDLESGTVRSVTAIEPDNRSWGAPAVYESTTLYSDCEDWLYHAVDRSEVWEGDYCDVWLPPEVVRKYWSVY